MKKSYKLLHNYVKLHFLKSQFMELRKDFYRNLHHVITTQNNICVMALHEREGLNAKKSDGTRKGNSERT